MPDSRWQRGLREQSVRDTHDSPIQGLDLQNEALGDR